MTSTKPPVPSADYRRRIQAAEGRLMHLEAAVKCLFLVAEQIEDDGMSRSGVWFLADALDALVHELEQLLTMEGRK